MSAPRRFDERRTAEHLAELRRRAVAVLGGDGLSTVIGPITGSILAVAARIGEEVSRRLDKVPLKQAANFYTEAGIGRDPARPAYLPVAFKLSDTVVETSIAARGTKLMAQTDPPVIFETIAGIDLVPGAVVAVRGLDAGADSISLPADAFAASRPPRSEPILRRLASAAAAGATKLQIDPAAKLDSGMLIEIGEGEAARQHKVVKVEGSLVTIEPPLEAGVLAGAPASEAAEFAPFAGATRNRQEHAFYLGHSKLLDLPSEVTIHVTGLNLPDSVRWSWWGKAAEDDPPAWQDLERLPATGLQLRKRAGKPAKTKVGGHETLWLRALLPGKSMASSTARGITLAVGGEGCAHRDAVCSNSEKLTVGFDAIANTTPVVVNQPFHPFGREPRLYDSFYVGSDEAFSKAGAEASLCFEFAGAELGPLAGVAQANVNHVFGVGTDGLLYRFRLGWTLDQVSPSPLAANAVVRRTSADFRPVSPPQDMETSVYLPSQSPLAAWQRGNAISVAAASRTEGLIHVATSTFEDVRAEAVKWTRLIFDPPGPVDSVAIVGGSKLYALSGNRLFVWDAFDDEVTGTLHLEGVRELLPLAEQDNALILVDGMAGVSIHRLDTGVPLATVAGSDLPSKRLRAHLESQYVFIAGYGRDDADLTLAAIPVALRGLPQGLTAVETLFRRTVPEKVPVAFSSAGSQDSPPLLALALDYPLHVGWNADSRGLKPVFTQEPHSIGSSINSCRSFLNLGPYTYVHRSSEGLLYRASLQEGSSAEWIFQPATSARLIAADLPAGAKLAIAKQERVHRISDPSTPRPPGSAMRLLEEIPGARTNLEIDDAAILLAETTPDGTLSPAGDDLVTIQGSSLLRQVTLHATKGTTHRVWRFTRDQSGDETWPAGGFDAEGEDWTFVTVRNVGEASTYDAAILEAGDERIARYLGIVPLWIPGETDMALATLHRFTEKSAVLCPADALFSRAMWIVAVPPQWESVGPAIPANPALSWEYWNGSAWWALATEKLYDASGAFQRSGGVFFRVPADLVPTEVAGKKSHWIRARLVGGDYGEAQVTVTTSDKVGGKTEQVAKRDTSTIRAPYVTSLRLGYCALDPVRPEIVLTQDNLGYVDQTSANDAALEFPLFVPVAETMNPRPLGPELRRASGPGGCGDICVEPAQTSSDPCAQPGARDSCDNPCTDEPDGKPAQAAGAAGFERGLMIGLDRPFKGNDVSIYFEAAPAGPPATLVAEMLRDGRFVPVRVVADTSHGLTESGLVTLHLPASPDRSDRLGASAHWLRLRPKFEASLWSPRLRGLHLNAVAAESIETRRMERVGTSDATPNQTFRLAEAPVAPDTLELRIRESLEDAERAAPGADVVTYERAEGEWVRWKIGDREASDDGARVFSFDPEQGAIRFGDGRYGRIPPLGAELLAVGYAKVHGSRANGVAAGAGLQPISPLAGVESVLALDPAAGGTDAETVADGVRRAAAKVRHGGRIVSLADVEEVAATLAPGIAQVRAERRRGGVRLIVVGGREGNAWLRQMRSQIAEMSGYGLARPGGLEVVRPRNLELGVEIDLEPPRADRFSDAATLAVEAVTALFDPAAGGHDGKGWPLGRLPDESDVAAALVGIEDLATPARIALFRIDKRTGSRSGLPETLPSDVMVRLDPASLVVERAAEAAA